MLETVFDRVRVLLLPPALTAGPSDPTVSVKSVVSEQAAIAGTAEANEIAGTIHAA
jgi:hypothetical protein